MRGGMITRTTHVDGHDRYELTDLGRTLHAPLLALQHWAESHVEQVMDAQDRFDTAAEAPMMTPPATRHRPSATA